MPTPPPLTPTPGKICCHPTRRAFWLALLALGTAFAGGLGAQSIVNPYWDEPNWKNWYLDPEPVVNTNSGDVLALPEPEHRLFPADVPATETNPAIFLHYEGEDYPGRPYAGFWGDVYASFDGYHSRITEEWFDDYGNHVNIRPNGGYALQRMLSNQTLGYGENNLDSLNAVGLTYSTISIHGRGASDYAVLQSDPDFERYRLYANNAYTAQGTATNFHQRYVPLMFISRGASGSASIMTTKLALTSGYLHRDLKPEVIRHGLLGPTLHFIMRSALPYDAAWEDNLIHSPRMFSNGYGNDRDPDLSMETIDDFNNHYDPHLHLKNMVQKAKELTVIPPIVNLELVELIEGINPDRGTGEFARSGAANVSSQGYFQPFGTTFQARIKAVAQDANGLPTEVNWALTVGDKNTRVVSEGNNTYLITIPHDPDLPAGRTTLIAWADNGVTKGLPAAVNVLRSDTSDPLSDGRKKAERVPLPTGYQLDSEWVPGETVIFDLQAPAPSGYPVSWTKWEGVGTMDGNRYQWDIPSDQPEGVHYAVMIGTDGTHGEGLNGAKARMTIKDVVARPTPKQIMGLGPQTVAFDATASAAKDGQTLTYAWDFDSDGSIDSTDAAPSHTFSTPGVHQVVLTASSASLGKSDETAVFVEVRPEDWRAEIWDNCASAPDPSVWNLASGSVEVNDGRWLLEHAEDGDGNFLEMARLETLDAPERPFAVEIVFEDGEAAGLNYMSVCGLAVGSLQGERGEDFEIGREISSGEISDIEPLSGDLPERDPHRLTRVYVRDDPDNPGKVIVSGVVRSEFGETRFYRNNWEMGDGKVALVGKASRESTLEVEDFRLWQPGGDYPDPALFMTDANGRTLLRSEGWNLGSSHFGHPVHDASDFGMVAPGETEERTFTLRNAGSSDLELSWRAPDYAQTLDVDGFAMLDPVNGPVIAPGGSEDFTLRFTPTGGRQGILLRFLSNAEGFRTVFIGRAAEEGADITVEGSNVNLASGDTTPDPFDGTHFGSAVNGETVEQNFLVRNIGQTPLSLGAASVSNTTDFSIVKQPRSPLGWDGSSQLRIAFHPASVGEKTAVVTIPSDDPDTPTYTFTIAGNGLGALAPEISITGSTDFGSVPLSDAPNGFATRALTIANTGDGPLRLTSAFPHAEITGPDADAFQVFRAAPDYVHPGNSVELTLLFRPQKVGAHSATLTLYSDDPDAPQTIFSLSGNGIAAPAIEVRDTRGVIIENGDAYPREKDGTAFGTLTGSGSINRTFVIHNRGTSTLNLTAVTFSGSSPGEFAVVNYPSSIAANSTGQLELSFSPGTAGSHEAIVSVASNDPLIASWDFTVSGSFTALRSRGDRGVDRGLWEETHRGVAWGDYDNDGDLDLIVTGSSLVDGSRPDFNQQLWGMTSLYQNDGSGNFTEFPTNLPDLRYSEAAWGDYDGDGDLDLIISGARYNEATYKYENQADIYRNDNGEFFPISAGLTALRNPSLRWVDYDCDGDLDLFMSGNSAGDGQAANAVTRIYRNDNGVFTDAGVSFPENFYDARTIWADANGNGCPDILIFGKYGDGFRKIYAGLNDGTGAFNWTLLEDQDIGQGFGSSVDWMDINGDGLLDSISMFAVDGVLTLVSHHLDANGNFTQQLPLGLTQEVAIHFFAGDLDSDGYSDLAFHDSDNNTRVAFNQGLPSGALTASSSLTNVGGSDLAIGDFNADGVNDIFTTGRKGTGLSAVNFLLGEGAVNTPPDVPEITTVETLAGGGLKVTWLPASDPDYSEADTVRYSVRVGTTPGGGDIKPAMGDSDGYRRVPALGEIGGTEYTLRKPLPPGLYYVAVQAVDPGFAGSVWSEVEFRIEAELDVVDDALTVEEGSVRVLDVLANDGAPFLSEITEVTQPAYGTISIASDGQSLRYNPEGYWGQHGSVSFSYTLTDFDEEGDVEQPPQIATVTLTIDGVRTDTASLTDRTLAGIGLDAGQFSARTRIEGDTQLEAAASGVSQTDSDQLVFAYRTLTGDFSETLRILSLEGGNAAQVGLMARPSTDADAVFAQVSAMGDSRYSTNHRSTQGQVSSLPYIETADPTHSSPDRWVRISRSGDTLNLGYSGDGESFETIDTLDISDWNSDSLLIGEFLASGDESTSANARMGEINYAALDDSGATDEGQSLNLDVLANDSTAGTATITAVTQPAFGAVTILSDQTLVYNPLGYYGWSGPVTFTYTAEENGASDTATVTITVNETESHNELPGFDFDGLDTLGSGSSDGRIPTATGHLEIGNSGSSGLSQTAAADSLSYLWEEALGDFKAIVRLRALDGASSRAGLMLRENSGTRARTVWIGADQNGQLYMQARETANTPAETEQASPLAPIPLSNLWLRIERYRDTVRLFASANGSDYSQIGQTVTLADLAGKVQIGLFTYAGGSNAGSMAEFSEYTLEIETEPGIANGGTIDNGRTHNLTSLGTDDWVIWGEYQTGQVIRKAGGSGRIGNLSAGTESSIEVLLDAHRSYNSLTWSDGTPIVSRTAEKHGVVVNGPLNDPASVQIPVGRGEGTVHVIFSVDNSGDNNMRGQATVLSSEPGVDPLTIAPLQTNQEGYNVSFNYVSAREDTVLTVQMAKIIDDSPLTDGVFVPQAIALTHNEIPGGDGGPPFFLPVNTAAPVAVDDAFTIVGDSNWLLDVTANDTDPDAWQSSPVLASVTQPSHGTAAIQSGKISYTPNVGYYGEDSFTYTATDGEFTSNEATVAITILDPSDPADSDNDGLPDVFELAAYGDLSRDGSDDFDSDGVTDLTEVQTGRNPAGIDRIAYDFLDDFERGPGVLPDVPGLWTIASGATAEIKPSIGTEGSYGLELFATGGDPAELTLHLPGHWRDVSWKQLDAILVPYLDDADTPSVDTDAAVAFYLTESGDLRIRDGADWYALGLTLDPAAMHRYTVRQDYITQTWKLWVDGNLVVDPPAAFANPRSVPAFVRISHSQDEAAVFDNFAITAAPQNAGVLTGLATFDAWSGDRTWNGADGTPTGDPNANGLSNLLEYAFGFADPVNGTHAYATSMAFDESGPVLTLTYRRNRAAEDLSFTVQTSSDLSTWTDLEPGTADVTITPSAAPGVDYIAVKVPMTADHLFVRLRVRK